MRHTVRIAAGGVFLTLLLTVLAVVGSEPVQATPGCEFCADANKCGGGPGDNDVPTPGWVNSTRCQGKSAGTTCAHCSGTNNLRNCVGSGFKNNKKCTFGTSPSSCGQNYPNSKCAMWSAYGFNIMYCKVSGSASGGCSISADVVCTGDTAYP